MKVLALAGGVGGGRLAHGLYQALPPDSLTVLVNTADDFSLHGLKICPDLDTVMYTLAGLNDEAQGWGLAGETWEGLGMLERLGAPTWFKLGDRDLGVHITRTHRLASQGLAAVTQQLASALSIRARLVPMCEEPVATLVETPDGVLSFQEYFVQRQQQDLVTGLKFEGIESARACAFETPDLVVLCPSNPLVSLRPILEVPGLELGPAPRVAVSPIVAGQAVKGPLGRMMASLGHEVSALGVARMYQGLVQSFVLDEADANLAKAVEDLGMRALVLPTLMHGPEGRRRLAAAILEAL